MPLMPRVLALDTATQACTLALWDEPTVRARHAVEARAHNRHVLTMLAEVLDGQRLSDAVDVIACGVGPGSFTGLRVAVSVAQGLAWSQNLPVHGFCSLTAQVHAAAKAGMLPDGAMVLTTIDAQINQLYARWGRWIGGRFLPEGDVVVSAPEALPLPDIVEPLVLIGSGANCREQLPLSVRNRAEVFDEVTPNAAVMAELFGTGALTLAPQPAYELSPQYVQRDIGWKKLAEQVRRG